MCVWAVCVCVSVRACRSWLSIKQTATTESRSVETHLWKVQHERQTPRDKERGAGGVGRGGQYAGTPNNVFGGNIYANRRSTQFDCYCFAVDLKAEPSIETSCESFPLQANPIDSFLSLSLSGWRLFPSFAQVFLFSHVVMAPASFICNIYSYYIFLCREFVLTARAPSRGTCAVHSRAAWSGTSWCGRASCRVPCSVRSSARNPPAATRRPPARPDCAAHTDPCRGSDRPRSPQHNAYSVAPPRHRGMCVTGRCRSCIRARSCNRGCMARRAPVRGALWWSCRKCSQSLPAPARKEKEMKRFLYRLIEVLERGRTWKS